MTPRLGCLRGSSMDRGGILLSDEGGCSETVYVTNKGKGGCRKDGSDAPHDLSRNNIQHTAQQSTSLMDLPLEIRSQIWEYAVGNTRIHLQSWQRSPAGAYWSSDICVHPVPPAEQYKQFGIPPHCPRRRGEPNDPNANEHDYHSSADLLQCHNHLGHSTCYTEIPTPTPSRTHPSGNTLFRSTVRSLLRVSRAVHAEALHPLYKTNTFIFVTETTLERFLNDRTPFQKQILANLEFTLEFAVDPVLDFLEADAWQRIFAPPKVRSLTGLRTVHVYLEELNPCTGMFWFEGLATWGVDQVERCLGRLRGLALERVTVVVSCDRWTGPFKEPKFTQKRRFELAERLRCAILPENGCEHACRETVGRRID